VVPGDRQAVGAAHALASLRTVATPQGTIGVISLRNKLEGEFTTDDLDFLVALAGSIALAIENALLAAN